MIKSVWIKYKEVIALRKKNTGSAVSAYEAALRYLTPKARTLREVELKLDEGDYSEGEIMLAVERLIDAGIVDDRKYARDFIESRLASKPVSRFRLREQLRSHFVDDDIIEEALSEVDPDSDMNNAVTVAVKFFRQFEKIEDEDEKRRRVYDRLKTRGFSHDTITEAMRKAEGSWE